VININ